MIDAIEPLSLVLWGVFFLAAGMYPLGFMLGSPCSPCCGGQCGDPPVEFNRCIRFVNTNTTAPATTYAANASVDMPLHGYSRAVTRPEQVGAVRVATKREVSCGTQLSMYAAAMSDGETRSSTYRIYYISADYNYTDAGSDIGTALQWNVTLQGVTRPLEMPAAIPSRQSVINGPGELYARPFVEYGVGDARLSSSAAVSASIHSVSVVSGGQWLDGAAVTDSTLKSLLAVSIEERNSNWVARLDFSPGTSVFQYVPFGSEASLSYVIKHSRGAQHRFKTFQVTVFKGSTSAVTAIPSGGLQAVATSQPPYEDTPYGVTPPVFSGSSATIYSDNAVWNGPYQSVTIAFPAVEISPTGPQLRSTLLALDATEGQHLQQSFANSYGRLAGTPTAFGWIMRPFDPGVGATFNGFGHPVQNQWNYDVAAVESFLSGDSTMPYSSGTTIDTPVNSWTMQVSDPTQFCGFPLCTRPGWYEGAMYGDAVENTVTVQTAPLPQSTTTSTENRTTTYINRCYGQDSPPVISMRLRPAACSYSGSYASCINYTSAIGYNQGGGYYINRAGQGDGVPLTRQRGAPARYFYCGDLLWAIEHGPCRSTLTIPHLSWGNETYTLGGSDSSKWANDSVCAFSGVDQAGKCHPSEATLSLDEDIKLGDISGSVFAGKIIAGDYVMSLVGFAAFYDTNCNQQVYFLNFPVQPVGVPGFNTQGACLVRRRELWCGQWQDTGCPLVGTPCIYAFNRLSGPQFGTCGLSIGPESAVWDGLPAFPGSVSFGQQTFPYATTVTPQATAVGGDGGNTQIQFCCPQRTQVATIPSHAGRFPRTFLVESIGIAGRGATAYITQAGYDGTSCPFDVIWLSGSTGYPAFNLTSGLPGRIFSSDNCPIIGQITHAEQPGCDWTATTGASWIVAKKNADTGLLEVSIDNSVEAVFAGSLVGYNKAFRSGNLTVSSGGTTSSWTIIQVQP